MINIIAIYGNCGSGKTTISKALAKELNIDQIEFIGKHRRKHKIREPRNDFKAWRSLRRSISKVETDLIYESTGLNSSESRINAVLDRLHVEGTDLGKQCNITRILLCAPKFTIRARLLTRPQQDDTYFPYKGLSFEDINEMGHRTIEDYDIVINTYTFSIAECVKLIRVGVKI